MKAGHRSSKLSSRFVGAFDRLFQGIPPDEISSSDTVDAFWTKLLELDVDRPYLEGKLGHLPKEECIGDLKSVLNALFASCLANARNAPYDEVRKEHALTIISIFIRAMLAKNLTGWEVMEIFAGGVSRSDTVFMGFAETVDVMLADSDAPASIRHQVLQVALTFTSGVGQLSPGAYFLRRDLFPSIVSFITSPDTEKFTFEAVLLLSTLANFHKSDAAKLNPYLQRIRETTDQELMRKICWAANFALGSSVKAYQAISDDSPPSLATSFGSMLLSFRPDRALASTLTDPPRESFKNQPIEASVILLPIFEFMWTNTTFSTVLSKYISSTEANNDSKASPLPFNILTLSSYLLTHASSSSSPRALAYANLSLHILLSFAEDNTMLHILCQPHSDDIRICRQRLPHLPLPPKMRPPVCALLDCCLLWMRHNLHKRLETGSYLTCIATCHRVIWYLQNRRIRLEYHWQEFWSSVIGLLNFLATKLDSLATTGGVEHLVKEAISLIGLGLTKAEAFMPTSRSIQEFTYELVRSSPILRKQLLLLQTLALPAAAQDKRTSRINQAEQPSEILAHILAATDFYEEKIRKANARSATSSLRVVAREIEADGLYGASDEREWEEPPKRSEDVLGFAGYASIDALSLMP